MLEQLPPDVPAEVVGSPVYVVLSMVLGVVIVLGVISDKVRALLGPLGKWFTTRTLRRVRARAELDDARVVNLRADVDDLSARVTDLRRSEDWHYQVSAAYRGWGMSMGRWGATIVEMLRERDPGVVVADPPPPPDIPAPPVPTARVPTT